MLFMLEIYSAVCCVHCACARDYAIPLMCVRMVVCVLLSSHIWLCICAVYYVFHVLPFGVINGEGEAVAQTVIVHC